MPHIAQCISNDWQITALQPYMIIIIATVEKNVAPKIVQWITKASLQQYKGANKKAQNKKISLYQSKKVDY